MTIGTQIAWDDTVLPFQLDASGIRGRVARLDGVLDQVLKQHAYPSVIEALVAESLSAGAKLVTGGTVPEGAGSEIDRFITAALKPDGLALSPEDNAAMIAFAALLRYFEGQSTSLEEDIHPNLPLV